MITKPLLYVRGYCQTLAGEEEERKVTGSGSALVEKEDSLSAMRSVKVEKHVQGSIRGHTGK